VISLPFESNFNFENGTEDDTLQYVLSIQPVLPFGIAENWNLIVRPIVPLISQDEFAQLPNPPVVSKTGSRTFGLGDSTLSFFLAPKEMKNGFVWGVELQSARRQRRLDPAMDIAAIVFQVTPRGNRTRTRRGIAAAILAAVLGCGEANTLLGEWEVDPQETTVGVLLLVRRTGDELVVFEADRVRLGPDELPIRYETEGGRVHLIRTDREFVHEVDLLESGKIRVHFPGDYTAVYRRASS
jgi:hypothetical protein